MKIAINASRAINEKAGVGRVAKKLTENLLQIDQENHYLLQFNFFKNKTEKFRLAEFFKRQNSEIRITNWPGQFQELWFHANFAKKMRADIYLAPTFLDFQTNLNIPQVVIIHDMTNFLFPEHAGKNLSRKYQQYTVEACQQASKIIAVSKSTKDDIVKFLKVPEEKIEVIYLGNTEFRTFGNLPQDLEPKKYLLFVGTIEPRKNIKNLLLAYKELSIEIRKKLPLVIVGAKGWNNAFELRELGQTEGVKWLGFVSDDILATLYKNAFVFIYPSLYEGFGIPIIEAQQFGVPVITSNVSSLPEAVGDGGILVNPNDATVIKEAIMKLYDNKNFYQDLARKALLNAQRFTWKECASKVLEVLKTNS